MSVWNGDQFRTPKQYVDFTSAISQYYQELTNHIAKQYMSWWDAQEENKPVAIPVEDMPPEKAMAGDYDGNVETFGLDQIAGKGIVSKADGSIGHPDPDEVVAEILKLVKPATDNGLKSHDHTVRIDLSLHDLKRLIAEEARRSFFVGVTFMETQQKHNSPIINDAIDNYGNNRMRNYEFKPLSGMKVTYN
jgi:hypothetical protein